MTTPEGLKTSEKPKRKYCPFGDAVPCGDNCAWFSTHYNTCVFKGLLVEMLIALQDISKTLQSIDGRLKDIDRELSRLERR